jgi:hypothetical protein
MNLYYLVTLLVPLVTISDPVLAAIIGAFGVVIGYIIKALAERSSLASNSSAAQMTAAANQTSAEAANAEATAAVVAAARELVEPLRRELVAERAEHAATAERERSKLTEVHTSLQAALEEAGRLRTELVSLRGQMAQMRQDWEAMEAGYRARIAELEAAVGRP